MGDGIQKLAQRLALRLAHWAVVFGSFRVPWERLPDVVRAAIVGMLKGAVKR
ncbi:MAG TPA: hypothetical protein VM186_11700 [Planctomycetota bacterium]|nr:hypothetical protein [Planctomycetota bacterium]